MMTEIQPRSSCQRPLTGLSGHIMSVQVPRGCIQTNAPRQAQAQGSIFSSPIFPRKPTPGTTSIILLECPALTATPCPMSDPYALTCTCLAAICILRWRSNPLRSLPTLGGPSVPLLSYSTGAPSTFSAMRGRSSCKATERVLHDGHGL
ncbi:hypothetical protein C8Q76DRAFT_728388 [Earliella scabrosa]|nr:hypothetical protein C8Q76DRAFT_728388 [Earliella scabrosa]